MVGIPILISQPAGWELPSHLHIAIEKTAMQDIVCHFGIDLNMDNQTFGGGTIKSFQDGALIFSVGNSPPRGIQRVAIL